MEQKDVELLRMMTKLQEFMDSFNKMISDHKDLIDKVLIHIENYGTE